MTILSTFKQSFGSLFKQGVPDKLAVGISGGVDSMVLIDLLMKIKPKHCRIFVITIDHRLRKDSAEEAIKVGCFLKKYPLEHCVLSITEAINMRQLERDARLYRYKLIENYCANHNITNVLLAHHKDDQLETMAMRLMKNSSFFGLCGMSKRKSLAKELDMLRPMLTINKSEIYQYAYKHNLNWVEDPTNQNPDLTIRNKIRFLISSNENLKNDLSEVHDAVTSLVESVSNSIKDFVEEIEWSVDSRLGFLDIIFDLSLLHKYHPIVINRSLYELIGKISCDTNYSYKYRKFDSVNSGVVSGNTSLIEQLQQVDRIVQLAYCNIEKEVKDNTITLKITRQREGLNNKAVSLIKINEWITFDNRFRFRFQNLYLNNKFIVNYNYKLHYKSLKNKNINKIATKYQLPVIVDESNNILLFPTLGGCEVDMIQRKL